MAGIMIFVNSGYEMLIRILCNVGRDSAERIVEQEED